MQNSISKNALAASIAVAFGCVFIARVARAEDEKPNPKRAPSDAAIQVSAGGQLLLASELCCRDGDMIGCTSPAPLLGFDAEASYRFARRWALGALGSAHWELDASKSVESCEAGGCVTGESGFQLWRAALEARFYPHVGDRAKLWLSIEGGVAGAVDTYRTIADGDIRDEESARDYAPELGMGIGLDLRIAAGLFVGFEIRGLLLMFGEPADTSAQSAIQATEIGTTFWPLFGFLKLGYAWDLT